MLAGRKPKKLQCVSNLKLKNWLESRLTVFWLSRKNTPFNGKISFLQLGNTGVKPSFFKISRLKLQKLLKSWKVNCGELPVEKDLLALPHIVKATSESETWPNPRVTVNSTFTWSFQQEPNGRYAKREFLALQ